MRVIVFSQVRLFGEALAGCLRERSGITSVESSYRVSGLRRRMQRGAPDVVLFDVGSADSLEDARLLARRCPETHILAMALPEVSEQVIACADAGFIGYIPRQASVDELLTSMQVAMRDELICSPQITHALFKEMRRRKRRAERAAPEKPLTPREVEVVRLLARGLSNKAIANELHLSVATIKNHLHNIFTKLGVHKRTQALALLRNEPWLAESA